MIMSTEDIVSGKNTAGTRRWWASRIKSNYDAAKRRNPLGAANVYSDVSAALDKLDYDKQIPENADALCTTLRNL